MPRGTQYCSECLIRPFSKARLFLRQFGSQSSHLFCLGMASGMSFRHYSLQSSPYQTTASQEIPTDSANCAPPQLVSCAQSNLGSQLTCMVGLSFLLQVILSRYFNEITFLSLSSRFFSSFPRPPFPPQSLLFIVQS